MENGALAGSSLLNSYRGHFRRVVDSLGDDFFTGSGSRGLRDSAHGHKYVIVAFTNRSGSNYLAELMASSGQINLATELLNAETIIRVSRKQGLKTFRDYFLGSAVHGRVGGIFAFKAALDHFYILERAGMLDEILGNAFVIHIERSDKILQAISLDIAMQTERWASYQGPATRVPRYAQERVAARLQEVTAKANDTTEFLAYRGTPNLSVSYELLTSCPQCVIEAISKIADIDGLSAFVDKVAVQRQATETNLEWRRLFLESRHPLPISEGS